MKSLNIGLLGYEVTPGTVFVRVPNERGRWMLVDRSVVEVDCPFCKAITGEPCRSRWQVGRWHNNENMKLLPPAAVKYTTAVHVHRKTACAEATGTRRYASSLPTYKLRVTAEELADGMPSLPPDPEPDPPPPDIDVPVTRKDQ